MNILQTVKPVLTLAVMFAASATLAAPYCTDLSNAKALPKKFAKIAPLYSDAQSGWVFSQHQLIEKFAMKRTAQELLQSIVDEFKKRNVKLAIVVPPPRPTVAGQAALAAAQTDPGFDLAAAQSSFAQLMIDLEKTGAIVPDLAQAAHEDVGSADSFYFRRDTHWTARGAAISALALANKVQEMVPDLFPNAGRFGLADLVAEGSLTEKGSLAKIVRQTCDISLAEEVAPTYALTRGGNLLASATEGASIALLGSSFSDRYKRDHYRFADAIAWAFDAEVENLSISGGGPIGAIEPYVLSGALDRRDHPLVIWEIPYTERFNNTSFLRQLLGALQRQHGLPRNKNDVAKAAPLTIPLEPDTEFAGIEVVTGDTKNQSVRLTVTFSNGSTSAISLGRRKSVPADRRTQSLFGSLRHYGTRTPIKITVTPAKNATISAVSIF